MRLDGLNKGSAEPIIDLPQFNELLLFKYTLYFNFFFMRTHSEARKGFKKTGRAGAAEPTVATAIRIKFL